MSGRATSFSEVQFQRRPARVWRVAVRFVADMLAARRTRRLLEDMDPRLLKDIGVSRSEAMAEIARAPWDFGPPRRDQR